MSLLDLASLVLAPTATKEGKVYSAIPDTGDGDLSFTRSNDTATRVNSVGLIEKVRTNLQIYSEDFRNIAEGGSTNTWTPNDTIILSTNNTAPDGTLSATRIRGTSGSNRARQAVISSTSGVPYTGSFFIRRVSGTALVQLRVGDVGTTSTLNPTSDWERYTYTISPTTTTIRLALVFSNDTAEFEIWGAQLERSDIATEYIPTTSAAVSVGMTANVPRVDYSGGGCPKLLLEPQRSNLVTYSEQMNNSDWGKSNAIITANDTASPDGYTNADKITDNANNNQHRVTQNISVTSGTSYTASIFVKNDDKGDFTINFTSTGFPSTKIVFNLINGTITSGTGTIEDYGNGWYRISATAAANITGSGTIGFNLGDGGAYVGTGESVFIWGAQIEAGSYSTSYIPTLSAASTRGQDVCSKTGISSLIGQTEGTLFAEINVNRTGINQNIELGDGTSSNRIDLRLNSNNNYQLVIVQGGVVVVNQTSVATFTQGQRIKLAAVYKSGDVTQLFVNGVSVLSATDRTITGSLTAIYSGSIGGSLDLMNSPVNELIVFPTALTDTQAIELTTI
jgi:hypothetical protein